MSNLLSDVHSAWKYLCLHYSVWKEKDTTAKRQPEVLRSDRLPGAKFFHLLRVNCVLPRHVTTLNNYIHIFSTSQLLDLSHMFLPVHDFGRDSTRTEAWGARLVFLCLPVPDHGKELKLTEWPLPRIVDLAKGAPMFLKIPGVEFFLRRPAIPLPKGRCWGDDMPNFENGNSEKNIDLFFLLNPLADD